MHYFRNRGDHLGPIAIEILPKKLHNILAYDHTAASGGIFRIPHGWGFYTVEGLEWERIAWACGCLYGSSLSLCGLMVYPYYTI